MTVMSEQIIAALVAAVVSALVSLSIAIVQLRQRRNTQRAQVQQDITKKYDKMVDYRLQHPEVLTISRRWQPACFGQIYNQRTEEDKSLAIYYGYVELCIAYCNAVLYAFEKDWMDPESYESEHEPLIRLILAEHFPILSTIAKPGKYVSTYLVNHVEKMRQGGWDWEATYKSLEQ